MPASAGPGFEALPGAVLVRLAHQLPNADRLALGAVPNRHLRRSIEHHVLAADIEQRQAPAVQTLAPFVAVLGHPGGAAGTVAALPPALQAQPLIALAGRITALPPQEQGPATQAFLNMPYRGPRHALLDELRQAAAQGDHGLRNRELALTQAGGAAHAAVSAGQHLGQVAAAHGIFSRQALNDLRAAARDVAREQIAQERHVPSVARAQGLDLPGDLVLLNDFAATVTGQAMVARGVAPDTVIEQLGIDGVGTDDVPHQQALRRVAAERDIELGQEVQAVATRYGVDDDIAALELHAAHHVGVEAVERREGTLSAVAARLGIVSEEGLRHFEELVVDGPGSRALQGGNDAAAVARAFGLERPESLARLTQLEGWLRQGEDHADAA